MRLAKLVAVVACTAAAVTLQATAVNAAASAAPKVKNGNILITGYDSTYGRAIAWATAPLSAGGGRVSTWPDDDSGYARSARYSPDGTRAMYIFINASGSSNTIMVRDVASGAVLQTIDVNFVVFGKDIDWSPDGTKLVANDGRALHIVDLTSETSSTIFDRTNSGKMLQGVTWSADGRWIAFTMFNRATAGDNTIRAVRPDGSGLHTIVTQPDANNIRALEWSPDASRLAYIVAVPDVTTSPTSYATNLLTVDAQGDGPVVNVSDLAGRTSTNHGLVDLSWSPDGRKIAALDLHRTQGTSVMRVRAYYTDGSSKYWLTSAQDTDEYATIDWGRKLS